MTPNPDYYDLWTYDFSKKVKSKFRTTSSNFKQGSKFIVRQDLGRLRNCHILVLNLGLESVNHHLTGAVVEVYEAYKMGIPVYAFTGEKRVRNSQADSPWLQEFISKEFISEQDLVDYLLNSENILV